MCVCFFFCTDVLRWWLSGKRSRKCSVTFSLAFITDGLISSSFPQHWRLPSSSSYPAEQTAPATSTLMTTKTLGKKKNKNGTENLFFIDCGAQADISYHNAASLWTPCLNALYRSLLLSCRVVHSPLALVPHKHLIIFIFYLFKIKNLNVVKFRILWGDYRECESSSAPKSGKHRCSVFLSSLSTGRIVHLSAPPWVPMSNP